MPSLNSNNVDIHVKTHGDTDGIDRTNRALGNLDDSSNRTGRSMGVMGAAFRASVAGVVAMGAATAAATVTGFGFNNSVEQAGVKLLAFTKSQDETNRLLAFAKDEASKTQFSYTQMANAIATLQPASKTSGIAVTELTKQAEILAALNPAEGLEGGAFALREALSGDFVSIVERFNLPRQRLNQLKEEGVPAMEAIRIALQEMGIDYSLVAAQGLTTAARWDQIKDKFTIMAGEMSKPIFDKVSIALQRISDSVDFTALGARLSGMVTSGMGYIHMFVEGIKLIIQGFKDGHATADGMTGALQRIGAWIAAVYNTAVILYGGMKGLIIGFTDGQRTGDGFFNKMTHVGDILRSVAGWVTGMLMPSLRALWSTIQNELLPTWQRLWNLLSPMIIPALVTIGAIIGGVVIAALWLLVNGLNSVINTCNWLVNVLINVRNWFFQVSGAIVYHFSQIPGQIGRAFSSVYHWITDPFERAMRRVSQIGDRISNKFNSMKNTASSFMNKLPGFATGVQGFSGGLAVVGERGPELVNLPKGSDVYSNAESRNMAAQSGGGSNSSVTYNIARVELSTDAAVRTFFAIQDRNSTLLSKGMSMVRT